MMGRVLARPSIAAFLLAGMLLILYSSFSGPLSSQDASHRRLVVQKKFEEPNQMPEPKYTLALTILRALLCLYIAPIFLLYGPAVRNLLIGFQAATAAGLWTWWDSMANIAYIGDIPPTVEGLVKLLGGAVVTGFAMMSWEDLDFLVKGALLASQFMEAFLPLVANAIHGWAGCKGIYSPAQTIRGQIYDTWSECENEDRYYAGIFMLKGAQWAAITLGALLAKKINKYLMMLSSCMYGAEMSVAALVQSIYDFMAAANSQEAAEDVKVTLLLNQMIFIYVFFGIGVVMQVGLMKFNGKVKDRFLTNDGKQRIQINEDIDDLAKTTVRYARWAVKIRKFAYPAMKFSASLNERYNTIDSEVKEISVDDKNVKAEWERINRPKKKEEPEEVYYGPKTKRESEKSSGPGSKKPGQWANQVQVVPAQCQGS